MRNAAAFALAVLAGPVGLRTVHPGTPPLSSALSAAPGSQSAPSAVYRGDWSADALSTWRGDDGEPRVQFNLRSSAGDSRWGFGIRVRDLAGLPPAALANVANDVQFSSAREAGTFRFTGSFDQGRGHGTYTFTPDQTFVSNMAAAGYKSLSSDDLIRLAVIDVTAAHVRGLAQAGYPNLSLDDVIRTKIHGATPENIKALQAQGIQGLSVEDLIKFRIHKVTPEFIQGLAQRGYKNVLPDDLVKMRIHNVTTAEMDQLKALGFGGMSIDDLVKFRIHKVTPEFIRSMREVGYVTVSEDQLVRMRIHRVDAQFVKDARADGFALQSPGDAVDLAIHGPRWRKRD